jgi:hypothetical protein
MSLFVHQRGNQRADTPFMNILNLSPSSPPLRIRLVDESDAKEYVLLVTKRGGLLLNKVVELKSQK